MSCNRKWGGQHPPYLDHEGIVGGILDFFFFPDKLEWSPASEGLEMVCMSAACCCNSEMLTWYFLSLLG